MDDLSLMDATAQAALVHAGEVSPTELVEAAIARITSTDSELNAIVTPLFDKGRREAGTVDPSLPLAGVPYVLKDHLSGSAGDPMSEGMRLLKDLRWAPEHDSHYVTRMRRAGLVLVGKANMPELALQSTTEPHAWGACHNPWDVSRSPGGSSGGSGAAVAAGLVPVAHATDAGGSIRIPSSLNGTVGLKPSRGRISQGPDVGDAWSNGSWYLGAITRSVRDTAALLDVLHGYEGGDPFAAPPPARPFADEVGADPGRLRVGYLARTTAGNQDLPTDIRDGVVATARLIADLGHHVDEAHPDALDRQGEGALEAFMTIAGSGVGWLLDLWSARTGRTIGPDDVEPATWAMAQLGAGSTGRSHMAAVETTTAFARELTSWWDSHDLLLTPTTATVAFPLHPEPDDDPFDTLRRSAAVTGGFTLPFNISGQPAISLPLHTTGDGLPVGMQLVAAYGREDLLLRVAAQLEQARPWADRLPAVHASRRD